MRLIGLALLVCLLSQPVHAQKTVAESKIVLANQVLQRVGAAYGFSILELPKLVIYPKQEKNRRIAYLELASSSVKRTVNSLDRSRLLMDEELFDACVSLHKGSEAVLAFVLSHEMAHFYLKHATFHSFAEQKRADMSETESRRQESEADQTGLLFAYLAGYDPEPALDRLFDTLYKQYGLAEHLPGYPSKSERQQATKLRTQEFRAYGYLFSVGQALYCREKFAEAARCFEFIYSRYPLKEAYNNFGVCRLQQIIRLKKKSPISYFVLPFEMDPRNRLLRMDERSETVSAADVAALPDEAKAAFRRAVSMDKTYQSAYLNQALGELLADNPYLSLGVLDELSKQSGQSLPPNSYLIRGIAYCALGDLTKAGPHFRTAVARGAYQGSYNDYIFQSLKKGNTSALRQPWQRLQNQPPSSSSLGCQAGAFVLQEIDNVPAGLRFGVPLIEQSIPPPFIIVDYGQSGTATYFRVKLSSNDSRTQQPNLFFIRRSDSKKSG